MAIPKYNELYSLFLFAIQDGAPHSSKDVKGNHLSKASINRLALELVNIHKKRPSRFFPGQALCILTL